MAETCPSCGRPAWRSHGGMGGGIAPDAETHCLKRDGHWCRTAAAGFQAGRVVGRIGGIDEGVRLAKERVTVVLRQLNDVSSDFSATWNWTDVDEAAAAAKGGEG